MYVISAGDTVSTATATPITVGRCTTGCIVPLCSVEAKINQVEGPQTSTDPFCYLLGPKSSLCLSFNKQILVGISISPAVLYGKGVSGWRFACRSMIANKRWEAWRGVGEWEHAENNPGWCWMLLLTHIRRKLQTKKCSRLKRSKGS